MLQNSATDSATIHSRHGEAENDRLRFALQAAGIGTWDIDPVRNEVHLDERCRELFGIAPGGQPAYAQMAGHLHPDDAAAVHDALQKALNPAGSGQYEVRYRTVGAADGKLRWLRVEGRAYFNEEGTARRFAGIAQDITAERQMQERAAAAQQMAELAIRSAGIGVFRFDIAGGNAEYSPAYAKIMTGDAGKTGLDRDAFAAYIHPDDDGLRVSTIKNVLRTGTLYYEPRVVWDDGSVHRIRVMGSTVPDEAGRPVAFSGTVRDITEVEAQSQALKKAEERFTLSLRQREAMFRNVTSSSPTGLWLSDEAGGLIYLNTTLTEWTGMPYEALLGAGWAAAVIDEDRQRAAEAFGNAIAARSHYDVMFRIKKGDGSIVWCQAAGDPYYHEDGSYAGYAGFCMDIDELVAGREAIATSEARFRSIVEQAPMAIALLSGREMVIEVGNSKLFEVWGKDRTITGKRLPEAWPEITDQGFMVLLESVYNSGEAVNGNGVQAKLLRNGRLEEAYFDFVFTPLREAAGAVHGVMVLATEVTEQVYAKKATEESEARFRSLVEEAPVATCLFVGREMRIEVANEIMLGYWGKGRSAIGHPLEEAIPELKGQPFLEVLSDVFTTGNTYEAKAAPVQLSVGGATDTYYFDFTYKPLCNSSGEVYAIMNMAVDVTEQVIARRELEESELFSRSIIDNSPVAKVVFIGEDMIIERVNQNMLAMLGRDASIIGTGFMEAIPELKPTPLMARLRHVLTTGETYHQPEEKLELIKSGAAYTGYYNYIYKALYNTTGEAYGIVVTAIEVTDQVLARQAIAEAEANLRSAIELAALGTWSIDLASGILDYSARLREWFGIGSDELVTVERAYQPILPADRPRVKAAITHAITPGTDGIYNIEYTIDPAHAGRERILHAQGKAFYNEQGEAYRISGTAQDVTEQRRIQLALEQQVQERTEELAAINEELQASNENLAESNAQLQHSNEELAQYAYVASHDLQEPLRKIRIFTGILENRQDLMPDDRELVGKIGRSASRMSLLIKDLLEFSRLLKSETLVRPVDLAEVTADVVSDFELAIKDKSASVQIAKLPVVQAVGLQMNQLFYNLLGNALKFSRPGVPPLIRIDAAGISVQEVERYIPKPLPFAQYYHITVADNGIGFDTRYAEQIFEVFKRLHGRDAYPGSGIGLALCRRIVANHNGHLYAASAPGEGTTFHLLLPDRQQDYQPSLTGEYHRPDD